MTEYYPGVFFLTLKKHLDNSNSTIFFNTFIDNIIKKKILDTGWFGSSIPLKGDDTSWLKSTYRKNFKSVSDWIVPENVEHQIICNTFNNDLLLTYTFHRKISITIDELNNINIQGYIEPIVQGDFLQFCFLNKRTKDPPGGHILSKIKYANPFLGTSKCWSGRRLYGKHLVNLLIDECHLIDKNIGTENREVSSLDDIFLDLDLDEKDEMVYEIKF